MEDETPGEPTDPGREAVEQFIWKVLEAQDEQPEEELGPDQMRALAARYGLDDAAYDQMLEEAREHQTRGLLFLDHQNWDEAVRELDQAYVIFPYDTELAFALGKTRARRYRQTGEPKDRKLAEVILRRVLDQDPDHAEAVRELTSLSQSPAQRSRKGRPFVAAIWFALALAAIGLLYLQVKERSSPPQGPPKTSTPPPEEKNPPENPVLPQEVVLPVTFPVITTSDELGFTVRSSILTRYEGKYGYRLHATVTAGPITITRMRARLELLDDDDTAYATHEFDILPTYRSAAIPGDSLPMDVLIFKEEAPPPVTEARLTMLVFEHNAFTGEPDPGRLLSFTKEPTLPPDIAFEVRERQISRTEGQLGEEGKTLLKLALVIENTGKREIRELVFQAAAKDKDGDDIPAVTSSIMENVKHAPKPGRIHAVRSNAPSLLPGERRVVDATIYLPDTAPDDVAGYRVEVVNVE